MRRFDGDEAHRGHVVLFLRYFTSQRHLALQKRYRHEGGTPAQSVISFHHDFGAVTLCFGYREILFDPHFVNHRSSIPVYLFHCFHYKQKSPPNDRGEDCSSTRFHPTSACQITIAKQQTLYGSITGATRLALVALHCVRRCSRRCLQAVSLRLPGKLSVMACFPCGRAVLSGLSWLTPTRKFTFRNVHRRTQIP